LACLLFILAAGPGRAQGKENKDRVVESLANCDLGKRTSELSLLFLIDESGSLKKHDPENRRVEGTVAALKQLHGLASEFTDITIKVAIQGFAQDYREHGSEWVHLDSSERLNELMEMAEAYRARNRGALTDYRKALEGAVHAFETVDQSDSNCRALVWFTDGEYDSVPRTDDYNSEEELRQISSELCAEGGQVDLLRSADITLIVIGLSNQATAKPPDLGLVQAVASGDPVAPVDLGLEGRRCGTLPGTGDLYQAEAPAELIREFAKVLGDSLYESLEKPPPAVPCTTGAKTCAVGFTLRPWVDRFDLYVKWPQAVDGRAVDISLVPPGREAIRIVHPDELPIVLPPPAALPGLPGVVLTVPTISWRKLGGTAEASDGIWDGEWQILFDGPGSDLGKANMEFFAGSLEVVVADGTGIDTNDPTTFSGISIQLLSGHQVADCGGTNLPVILDFHGQIDGMAPVAQTAIFGNGTSCEIPSGFLEELLVSGPGRDALKVEIGVSPSLEVVDDPNVPALQYPESPVSLWLQDAVVVTLADEPNVHITRAIPSSFEGIALKLVKGGRPFSAEGVDISLRFVPDDPRLAQPETVAFASGDPLSIPTSFFERALFTGEGRTLLRLDLGVTPSLMAGSDLEPTPELSSPIRLWIHDLLDIRRTESDLVLDRQDRATYKGLSVEGFLGGVPFVNDRAVVTLSLETHIGNKTVTESVRYLSGRPAEIPASFFTEVFDAAGDVPVSLLSVRITPSATIGGLAHPGLASSTVQFGVRSGPGYPTILSASATDIDDWDSSTLTVRVLGPDEGTGIVTVQSVTNSADVAEGTFTVEQTTCEIHTGEVSSCEAELSADFNANLGIQLEAQLELSGTSTDPSGQVIRDSVTVAPFEMRRPLNTVSFATTLLKLLLLFIAVQVLLRILFTTRLARWEGVEVDSRWSTLQVKVDGNGYVTAEGGGRISVDPASTMFASELEGRSSSAELGGITFKINWMRTFLGEAHDGRFIRTQRAVIRASSPTDHCIAPEGTELSSIDNLGTGLVGTGFLRCWVLQLAEGSLKTLADGETVSANLLVIFSPFDDSGTSAADQLAEVTDRVADVAGRELPNLIESATSGDLESDENPEKDASGDETDDGWPDDPRDPYDPFSLPPSPTTATGHSDESPPIDDWLSDPDDPFA